MFSVCIQLCTLTGESLRLVIFIFQLHKACFSPFSRQITRGKGLNAQMYINTCENKQIKPHTNTLHPPKWSSCLSPLHYQQVQALESYNIISNTMKFLSSGRLIGKKNKAGDLQPVPRT